MQALQKYFLNISFQGSHMIISNTLYYYGNDKDYNVSFDYSGGFLVLLLSLSLMTMMEILNNFLQVGNIVIFIVSIPQTFFSLYSFCPIFAPKFITMFYHVLQSYGSSIFFIFWCKMRHKLTLNQRSVFFTQQLLFICIIKCVYLPFMLNCTYIYSFFFLVNQK